MADPPFPLPGQLGDITFNDLTVTGVLTVLGSQVIPGGIPITFPDKLRLGATGTPQATLDVFGGTTDTMRITVDGVAVAGSQFPLDYLLTFSGAPGGASDVRAFRMQSIIEGSEDVNFHYNNYHLNINRADAGTTFASYIHHVATEVEKAGYISNAFNYFSHFVLGSPLNDVSGGYHVAYNFHAGRTLIRTTYSTTGQIDDIYGFFSGDIGDLTNTAGAYVNRAHHFLAQDTAAITSVTAYESQVNAGTGKKGFLGSGTAPSNFLGPVGFGFTSALTDTTQVQIYGFPGTLPAASQVGSALFITSSFAGNADTLSVYAAQRISFAFTGAESAAGAYGLFASENLQHTAGTLAIGKLLNLTMNHTGAGAVTLARVVDGQYVLNGAGVTTNATGGFFQTRKTGGAGTFVNSRGVHIGDSGGAHVTTFAAGIDIDNFTGITGGGIKAAIRSNMLPDVNTWLLHNGGGAPLYIGATYMDVAGMTEPSSPGADICRLFSKNNGGKTELRALFQTGTSVLVVAEA